MNAADVKTRCSIRGRVAFVLAIADQCTEPLRYNEEVFQLAASALQEAWNWQEGQTVTGDQLDYYLENDEEESLAVYGCDPPESASAAVMAITSAVAFVIWHAYKKDEITAVSSTIHEVSESVIDDVVGFAIKSPGFEGAFVSCVADYLVKRCATSDSNELGAPVKRGLVLNACLQHSRGAGGRGGSD